MVERTYDLGHYSIEAADLTNLTLYPIDRFVVTVIGGRAVKLFAVDRRVLSCFKCISRFKPALTTSPIRKSA